MEKTYEMKLAEKRARADARKAVTEWYKYGTIGIDRILKDMGYTEDSYSLYIFRKDYWAHKRFRIEINTYDLLHTESKKLKTTVEEF